MWYNPKRTANGFQRYAHHGPSISKVHSIIRKVAGSCSREYLDIQEALIIGGVPTKCASKHVSDSTDFRSAAVMRVKSKPDV